jgi:pseudoazurin
MKKFLTTSFAILATSTALSAQEIIEVDMLTSNDDGDRNIFSQELIQAEVGDTIRFLPTQKGHNAQSVRGAVPEGQEAFRGRINQEVEYEVTEAGLTAVVCLPHQAQGMVALVMVGNDVSNAEDVLDARIPGQGGDKIEALVEEARSMTEMAETEEDTSS